MSSTIFNAILLLQLGSMLVANARDLQQVCPPDVPTGLLPDLTVDEKTLLKYWKVAYEDFPEGSCEVIESAGNISPGTHKVGRFSVATNNMGLGDVWIGDPKKCHIDKNDGLYEFALCHGHWHFRNYATYELISQTGPTISRRSAKVGFCMEDTHQVPDYPYERVGRQFTTDCGTMEMPGNQGITRGWSDLYYYQLAGQFFNLDGLPSGDYTIRITVNPRYCRVGNCPGGDKDCSALPQCSKVSKTKCNDPSSHGCCDAQRGYEIAGNGVVYCHMLREADGSYSNNALSITVYNPSDDELNGNKAY